MISVTIPQNLNKPPIKRRKDMVNGNYSETLSDPAVNGKRINGRFRQDETDTIASSSAGSRERIPTKSYNKMSRGGPDRSTVVTEKAPSIEGKYICSYN